MRAQRSAVVCTVDLDDGVATVVAALAEAGVRDVDAYRKPASGRCR